jgi:hypothetical protein
MSIALDTGWTPDVVRTLRPQDVAALDAEIRARNRAAKRR